MRIGGPNRFLTSPPLVPNRPKGVWDSATSEGDYPGGRVAWVIQKFEHSNLGVELGDDYVQIQSGESLFLSPKSEEEAHAWALMMRRAARRFEEIGKGLGA